MIMAVKKNQQKGQALVELIIFLPLMFSLYGIISGFANAINGSINQQKITRGYFYFRIQNNSMVPKTRPDIALSWSKFGMHFIGWADFLQGDDPVHPCYEITIPLNADSTDACDQPYTNTSTQFIRVGTVYGVCGATFGKTNNAGLFLIPDFPGSTFDQVLDVSSCTISQ
jgi:hypothetical protein